MPDALPEGFVLDEQPAASAADTGLPEGFVLDGAPASDASTFDKFITGLQHYPEHVWEGLKGLVSTPREVLQGDKQVFNPDTGHVTDEAIGTGVGMALSAMPGTVAPRPGVAAPAAVADAAPIVLPKHSPVGAAAERLGVPVPKGVASDSPSVQAIYQRGRQAPGASGVVDQAMGDFFRGAENKVGDVAAQAVGGPVKDSATLGESVRTSIEGAVKKSEEAADRMFGLMRRVIDPEKRVHVLDSKVGATLDKVMKERAAAGESAIADRLTPTFNILTDPEGVSFNGLQRARSQVGKAIKWDEERGGFNAADLKQTYGALTTAMENAVRQSAKSNPDAAVYMWKAADKRYEKMIEDNKVLGSVLRKDADEGLVRSIISMASNKTGNLRKLSEVIRQIDPKARRDLAGYVIQGLGNGRNGQFSAAAFQTNWTALSPAGKSLLFRDVAVRNALDDLATVTKRMAEVQQKFDNASKTGGAVGQMAATAGMVTNPIHTIAGIVGANFVARALSKPATAYAAVDLARAQEVYLKNPGRAALMKMQQAEKRLEKIAARSAGAAPANDNSGVRDAIAR